MYDDIMCKYVHEMCICCYHMYIGHPFLPQCCGAIFPEEQTCTLQISAKVDDGPR